MTEDRSPVPLLPLERGYLHATRLGALIAAIVVGALLLVAYLLFWPLLLERGAPGFIPWLAIPVAGVMAWMVAIAPARRFRAWGYALAGDELHVAHGVWTWVHTIVPLARVQHLDIAQGPIDRLFRISRLIVHTAGTDHAVVVLPGIARETAEELRDVIRAHIRQPV